MPSILDNKNKPNETPKVESTGTVKDPETGNSESSDSTTNKDEVITGDKSSSVGAENKKAAVIAAHKQSNNPNNQSNNQQELPSNISEVKGEVLYGDSFILTFKRGNLTFKIPVPVEGTRNTIVLDNTFRIVKAIQDAKNINELNEKFAAFISK